MTPKANKSLITWKPVSERIITARFNGRHTKATIITCYAPTNDAEDELKDNFYEQLQKEIDATPAQDLLLIIGGLNAKVGSCNEGRDQTMGKHECGEMSENGERLADICGLNNFGNRWDPLSS